MLKLSSFIDIASLCGCALRGGESQTARLPVIGSARSDVVATLAESPAKYASPGQSEANVDRLFDPDVVGRAVGMWVVYMQSDDKRHVMTEANYGVASGDVLLTGVTGHTDLQALPDDVQAAIVRTTLPANARHIPPKDAPVIDSIRGRGDWKMRRGFARRDYRSASLAERMPAAAADMSNSSKTFIATQLARATVKASADSSESWRRP